MTFSTDRAAVRSIASCVSNSVMTSVDWDMSYFPTGSSASITIDENKKETLTAEGNGETLTRPDYDGNAKEFVEEIREIKDQLQMVSDLSSLEKLGQVENL